MNLINFISVPEKKKILKTCQPNSYKNYYGAICNMRVSKCCQ